MTQMLMSMPPSITCPFCESEHTPGWLHDLNMDRGSHSIPEQQYNATSDHRLMTMPAQQEPWVCECKANSRQTCKCAFKAQQEPVVWMYQDKSTHAVSFQKHMRAFVDHGATYETPLYTRPQAREPLTPAVIASMWAESCLKHDLTRIIVEDFARAIEAAHGIGEKK